MLTLAGTRPEAIKLAPLAIAAAARPGIAHRLVATGQHAALFHQTLAAFGVAADADFGLLVPGQSIEALAASVSAAVTAEIARDRPDLLIVQGDTTSAWAAALAADAAGVPVGHVEAGLRSGDPLLPWPEERNRIEIDRVATLLFAPTPVALANLRDEPDVHGVAAITGNTGIDALLMMRDRLGPPDPRPDARRLVLVTAHRRENIGAGIAGICAAIVRLTARGDIAVALPVHPNPAVQAQVVAALGDVSHVSLLAALDYPAMVRMMTQAHLILSDSGGVQEEAPALGVPLLVLRENSERPEAVAAGNASIVGTDPDRILAAATRLLDDPAAHAAMARPAFPFGRGDAADTIVDLIEGWHAGRSI
ncbi:non-hydrolyzing UDP-N-acetylglucosamine 2-epimerase [Sphingomonas solaris]|uniref:UDP-N-acetylglucosamine 2-epimerase (non-hydrolyzing) n=1 Tax=Alterirhizorhabdus solaris TaxID=2529389 RepID=A0A558QRG1_9SPHN|nr:UDP-N-acetylglucosamine 2-epimerase (non-hydrolyzing) [Sphingomonas solaris]TVV69726.1 UDP-N-acetylglucosamine 2-epimerase (non-hydrolyzing) [Sphingomonas solaris]